jgi:hypothetical protein
MQHTNLDAANAFLTAFSEYQDLSGDWIGWPPHNEFGDFQGPSAMYDLWQSLLQDLGMSNSELWRTWQAKCEDAQNRIRLILATMAANVPGLVCLIAEQKSDACSKRVYDWYADLIRRMGMRPWNLTTPEDVAGADDNGRRDFEEIFASSRPMIDEEVHLIIDHAIAKERGGNASVPIRWISLAEAEKICNSALLASRFTKAIDAGVLKSNGQSGKGKRKIDVFDFIRWVLNDVNNKERTESDAAVAKKLRGVQNQ